MSTIKEYSDSYETLPEIPITIHDISWRFSEESESYLISNERHQNTVLWVKNPREFRNPKNPKKIEFSTIEDNSDSYKNLPDIPMPYHDKSLKLSEESECYSISNERQQNTVFRFGARILLERGFLAVFCGCIIIFEPRFFGHTPRGSEVCDQKVWVQK